MDLGLVECAAGVALAGITLRDVFGTAVIPGESRGLLKASRRIARAALPAWKRVRGEVTVGFAPLVLVTSFLAWMALLVLAFGLMAHGLGESFTPALTGFGDALYRVGGAMTTMGMGQAEPSGLAALVSVAAGFCGLAVMTLAITYLLQVQGNIGRRDTLVLKLTTTAGQPPSALTLLERHAALGCRGELESVLREGRDWCATLLQSHASHPSLIYFRSVGTGSGWPSTLGTIVDLALIVELLLDEPQALGPAVLAREEARRLACELARMLQLEPRADRATLQQARDVCQRLAAAGYPLRETPDLERFVALQAEHVGPVRALSHHLGTPPAPLLPGGEG